ncbi:hypothetical protein BS47DRAFT_724985 [Hydnum rufescens UP504]|uniref:Uncharacterized protein n=1 Tax=Hydnum rufescens UP504 TaxID=1448309 RepID=A0A9P6DZD1_9AGAM|nr:hypothetical protein BS47DRAFT_724985 [Hydnum rufescens UP504]
MLYMFCSHAPPLAPFGSSLFAVYKSRYTQTQTQTQGMYTGHQIARDLGTRASGIRNTAVRHAENVSSSALHRKDTGAARLSHQNERFPIDPRSPAMIFRIFWPIAPGFGTMNAPWGSNIRLSGASMQHLRIFRRSGAFHDQRGLNSRYEIPVTPEKSVRARTTPFPALFVFMFFLSITSSVETPSMSCSPLLIRLRS